MNPTHRVLPIGAVLALQRAAATPHDPRDPLKRRKAIEQAIESVRAKHPDFFKVEQEVCDASGDQ